MKIIVLNPQSKFAKNVVRDVIYGCWCKGKRIGGGTVPPFGLLMVASILKNKGHSVWFLDASAEGKNIGQIAKIISGYQVVIILTSTMTVNEDAEALSKLKEINPSLVTIVFGSHPTFRPKDTLAKIGIDIIIMGEPEFIAVDLLAAFERGDGSWKKVKGIGYKQDKEYKLNERYPLIENLDTLPFVDRSMLPKEAVYFNPIVKKNPYTVMVTSRGCLGQCTYCTVPYFYGARHRYRSAKNVIEELKDIQEEGYREVYFRDETFAFSKERIKEISYCMLDSKINISWICNARIGILDRESIKLMKEAGCHLIKFGVESGVQEILDRAKKGIKISETREAFLWTNEIGIDTHAHVMLGMPGESKETIDKTIKFINEIRPTTVSYGICTPYPGSLLFEEVESRYPEIKDGSAVDLSMLHTKCFFNECFTSLNQRQLEESVRHAYRNFYMKLPYILSNLKRIRNIDNLKRYFFAGLKIFDFSLRGE
ncbi:MAG: B12-binding domain-containing radical SAM protein [Candidatus Omnitrophica bacterium]|nr:B12-binding domain-containing radical SAM protein [Candidatus Omnitrophota bacterium]